MVKASSETPCSIHNTKNGYRVVKINNGELIDYYLTTGSNEDLKYCFSVDKESDHPNFIYDCVDRFAHFLETPKEKPYDSDNEHFCPIALESLSHFEEALSDYEDDIEFYNKAYEILSQRYRQSLKQTVTEDSEFNELGLTYKDLHDALMESVRMFVIEETLNDIGFFASRSVFDENAEEHVEVSCIPEDYFVVYRILMEGEEEPICQYAGTLYQGATIMDLICPCCIDKVNAFSKHYFKTMEGAISFIISYKGTATNSNGAVIDIEDIIDHVDQHDITEHLPDWIHLTAQEIFDSYAQWYFESYGKKWELEEKKPTE